MILAKLDQGYAQALLSGVWPSEDVLPSIEKLAAGKALNLTDMVLI